MMKFASVLLLALLVLLPAGPPGAQNSVSFDQGCTIMTDDGATITQLNGASKEDTVAQALTAQTSEAGSEQAALNPQAVEAAITANIQGATMNETGVMMGPGVIAQTASSAKPIPAMPAFFERMAMGPGVMVQVSDTYEATLTGMIDYGLKAQNKANWTPQAPVPAFNAAGPIPSTSSVT